MPLHYISRPPVGSSCGLPSLHARFRRAHTAAAPPPPRAPPPPSPPLPPTSPRAGRRCGVSPCDAALCNISDLQSGVLMSQTTANGRLRMTSAMCGRPPRMHKSCRPKAQASDSDPTLQLRHCNLGACRLPICSHTPALHEVHGTKDRNAHTSFVGSSRRCTTDRCHLDIAEPGLT